MWNLLLGFLASYGLICVVRNAATAANNNDLVNKLLGYAKENEWIASDETTVKASPKKKV